jgi:hypothetical protein
VPSVVTANNLVHIQLIALLPLKQRAKALNVGSVQLKTMITTIFPVLLHQTER